MWAWLWLLTEVVPVILVAAGVYMVITRRVPRYPTYAWEWNYQTYTTATDIRALGWYYLTLGGSLGAFAGYVNLLATGHYKPMRLIPPFGLFLVWLLLLGVARRWRRRAFAAPAIPEGEANGWPPVDPPSD
jgi:hypothetical protein